MTLRGALSMKDADAFRSVYCWQTVRCLELWSRVLAEHAPTSVRDFANSFIYGRQQAYKYHRGLLMPLAAVQFALMQRRCG